MSTTTDHRGASPGLLAGARPSARLLRDWLGIGLWAVVVLASAVWLYWHGLLGRMGEHWPVLVPLVLVGLIISGQLGDGFGLPSLFRNNPDLPWWRVGRSVLSGFGVALLVLEVTTIIYYGEWIHHFHRVVQYQDEARKTWEHGGNPLLNPPKDEEFGLVLGTEPEPLRGGPTGDGRPRGPRRDDPRGIRAIVVHVWTVVVDASRTSITALTSGRWRGDPYWIRIVAFYVYQTYIVVPIAGMLALCVALPTPEVRRRRQSADRPALRRGVEIAGYVAGAVAACPLAFSFAIVVNLLTKFGDDILRYGLHVLALTLISIVIPLILPSETARRGVALRCAWGVASLLAACGITLVVALLAVAGSGIGDDDGGPASVTRFHQTTRQYEGSEGRDVALAQARHFIRSVGGFCGYFVVVFSAVLLMRVSPGLGICLVFCLACLGYLALNLLAPDYQLIIVGTAVAVLVLINSDPFKYRFPGMRRYYDGGEGEDAPERGIKVLEEVERRIERGEVPETPEGMLSDRKVLEAWGSRHRGPGGEKPKLVLVATSGGAYRASFWTTIVLESLDRSIPGFLGHVRLITGASGGMVGASYVAALLQRPGDGRRYATMARSATEVLEEETGRDSLTPVARQLVSSDLRRALWFRGQIRDRGRVLEEQWGTLDKSFAELRDGEAEGWRPSLVLSPMIVETGRRLLFSNLDLFGLTEAREVDRDDVSFGPADRERVARDVADRGQAGGLGPGRLYSRSAVEFFRAFPAAYGAGGPADPDDVFRLATAVRMNASFPYLSPAVSLPVRPMRRVVDAGYSDNFGITLAMAWVFHNRRWIRSHTSGLALVQIRAYESELERKRLWVGPPRDEPRSKTAAFFATLSQGVQFLTTPPQAASSVLGHGMAYRNDDQISILDNYFNESCAASGTRFFESFVFENPIPFGMNWFVTRDEVARMRRGMEIRPEAGSTEGRAFRHNLAQQRALREWFGEIPAADRVATDGSGVSGA